MIAMQCLSNMQHCYRQLYYSFGKKKHHCIQSVAHSDNHSNVSFSFINSAHRHYCSSSKPFAQEKEQIKKARPSKDMIVQSVYVKSLSSLSSILLPHLLYSFLQHIYSRNIFTESTEEEETSIKPTEDMQLHKEQIGNFIEDEDKAMKDMIMKIMKSRRSLGIPSQHP